MEKKWVSPETRQTLLNLKEINNKFIPWNILKRSIICDKLEIS